MKLYSFCPFSVLCFGLMSEALLAHDPGLSTAVVRLRPDTVEVRAVFARADVQSLVRFDSAQSGTELAGTGGEDWSRLASVLAQGITILLASEAAPLLRAQAKLDGVGNVDVQLVVYRTAATSVYYRFGLFDRLPLGHRQFVSIQDEREHLLAQRLLSATDCAVAVAVPGSSDTGGPILNQVGASSQMRSQTPEHSLSDFLGLGVQHILTGYDHLLFLFGLLIVCANVSSSLKIITAFTLAHSITLALATLNLVPVPSRMVEPLIAASIVYVGIENLCRPSAQTGRWLLTFCFGLVHGLGFASALRDLGVGVGAGGVVVPLLTFNFGVELGQLAVAAMGLPIIWLLKSHRTLAPQLVRVTSTLIVAAGLYWLVDRIAR